MNQLKEQHIRTLEWLEKILWRKMQTYKQYLWNRHRFSLEEIESIEILKNSLKVEYANFRAALWVYHYLKHIYEYTTNADFDVDLIKLIKQRLLDRSLSYSLLKNVEDAYINEFFNIADKEHIKKHFEKFVRELKPKKDKGEK